MDNMSSATSQPEPLTYEETPIIEPVNSESSAPPPSAPKSSPSFMPSSVPYEGGTPNPFMPAPPENIPTPMVLPKAPPTSPLVHERKTSPIILFLLFAVIFGIGVFASSYIRQFLPITSTPKQETTAPTPAVTTAPSPYADWKTYYVISGITRKAVGGINFQLPPDVAELFCDGTNCASQGAYLPGKTRFTVAARGAGQVLTDYRGKSVTDFLGRAFIVTPTTIAGRPALDFAGDFSGLTVTGYSFTKMHGVMISVTDTLSLEVNHFTPNGVTADFAADDALFTKILETFTFTGLPTLTPTSVPTATSSAY